ncbi:MAG TPA: vanadium-dependent haloperoxidase [Phycisphaerae bacterium]|nr:vanadium-dependent haloperoxidase [Phycisphaerae bacterium]
MNSLLVPAERGPNLPYRTLAIMHAAMFDAVNGIERRYEPLHVTSAAPPGAGVEAAAIQAAYNVLSALRPGSQAAWDAQLAASLASLPGNSGVARSIAQGRAWGTTVANAIIAWRSTDGTATPPPPYVGSADAGYWRHAPLGAAPAGGYVYMGAVPFVLNDLAAFDPGPPYGIADRADALASALYAADVNETKARGGATSTVRSPAELDEALFLDACDLASLNDLLRSKLHPGSRIVDSARAFALLNLAWFDSVIVACRCKYEYALWRPFQAVRYADEDNNPATVPDAAWSPYLPTPSHPAYVSVLVTTRASLLQVIACLEGDCGPVELTAYRSAACPGGTRSFESLEAVSDACVDARVNVGLQFRDSAEVSQMLGRHVGEYIFRTALPCVRNRCGPHDR